jgi:methionyl-tRNA formyltransferase
MNDIAKVQLFSTDINVFRLVDLLPEGTEITALVYPSNRQHSAKVEEMMREADRRGIPILKHGVRKPLPTCPSRADAGICWHYTQVILEEDLVFFRFGILNNHGSAIPEYRGSNTLKWSIMEGEEWLGITWHGISAEVDAGPIWMESLIPIRPDVTAWELRKDMIEEGIRLFPQAWQHFRYHDISPRIPDLTKGRVWPPNKPDDSKIPPAQTRRKVKDIIRAASAPWPRAFVAAEGKQIFVDGISATAGPHTVKYTTLDEGIIHLHKIAGCEA